MTMAESHVRPARSSEAAGRRMKATRRRDTQAEIRLRHELWRIGLRYRVDAAPLARGRRRADVLFSKAKVAVYVDGCFWHGCPDHRSWPAANRAWWQAKLLANQARDRSTDSELAGAGWTVVRVWEHEDPVTAAVRVAQAVSRARLGIGDSLATD
jgi:DNA mismatch endonuclease (patch repair protein)